MATMKKVQVEVKLGDKFKTEVRIRDHALYVDQPPANGGEDAGPTPLEYLLISLAGCFGAIGRIIANQKKIALRSMEVSVEGELDLDVLLGKNQQGRAGFSQIDVAVKIDADMSAEEKKSFLEEIDHRCPISDNLVKTSSVSIELTE